MRARDAELHALVGAYALDAVSEHERARFERHLRGCRQCRDDLHGLREATARLGLAAAVAPRPAAREQTVQAAGRIRQVPPSRYKTGTAWHRTTQPWLARTSMAVAVALVAVAGGLGWHLSTMQDRIATMQHHDAAIAQVLGARDAVTLTASVTTGGSATVVMSHRADELVFTADGLTRLPSSRAYELWLMGPAGDQPVGMLPPESHGMAGPMVVGRLAAGDRLGLTVEPAAGSLRPTSTPIVLVGLGG
ncbi:MAG TPA: anti-sigma factor [Streptosporangiaceae bacterium]|jgi:anti-sigma-K factor RskA